MPDIQKLYETYAANTARFPALYGILAEQLGVSAESVAKAEVGFIPVDHKDNQAWAFPERKSKGDVIGIHERLLNDVKYAVPDSKRGLAYMVNRDTAQYEGNYGWERTSAERPCIMCRGESSDGSFKPSGCLYPKDEYDNPNAVICVRTPVGATKSMELGWLHVLDPTRQKVITQNYSILLPSDHPILIVEGWSDVLVAYDLGFVAVGKPGSKCPKLTKALTNLLTGRDVIVLGENDAGVGRAGMESTFDALQSTCANLTKLMPPKGVKDLRHWVENGLTQAELLSYIEKNGDQAPQDIDALSDVTHAKRFIAEYKHKIRFNRTSGKWMNYDGQRWSYDTGEDEAVCCYLKTTEKLWQEATACKEPEEKKRLIRGAQHAQSAAGRRGALSWAKSIPPIASGQKDYDQDDYLFNCLDCTIDLRTGEPRPHDPNDMITMLAPVNYRYKGRPKQPTLWFNGLDRWHSGEEDALDYLGRLAGMCLTGDTSSKVFPIFYGDGDNGKSVFLDTFTGLMGDYADTAADTLLTVARNNEHSTEIAALCGKRLVVASETEKRERLKVALVKKLTGDRRKKARFMHKDLFEFKQTATIVMCSNLLPEINDTKNAIWNRVQLMWWGVTIPEEEQDPKLIDKLKEEWTGILRWAIKGCLKWQGDGVLVPTDAIRQQTQEYRNEQDPMPEFVQHCTESDPSGPGVPVDFMYQLWRCWCSRDGSKPGKKNAFLRALLAACEGVSIVDGDAGKGQVILGIKTTDRAAQIESGGV